MKQELTIADDDLYTTMVEECRCTDHKVDVGQSFYFVYDLRSTYFSFLDDSFYDITGYPSSVIINHRIDFVKKYMAPDHLAKFLRLQTQYKKWLTTSTRQQREDSFLSFDFVLFDPHGQRVHLMYQSLKVKHNRAGIPIFLVGKCTNITHWKKKPGTVMQLWNANRQELTLFSLAQNRKPETCFSSRETAMIKLLASGMNSRAIADMMSISYNTANTHRRNMLKKAHVNNTHELVSYAYQRQLI